jgi:hypothetical protein
MSKTWFLLVFVSLKYCVEKRLLKTHVAFLFMKATVVFYSFFGYETLQASLPKQTANLIKSSGPFISVQVPF